MTLFLALAIPPIILASAGLSWALLISTPVRKTGGPISEKIAERDRSLATR